MFIMTVFLLIGLLITSTACGLINPTTETDIRNKNIESKINERVTELDLPESTGNYLTKMFQEKPEIFEDMYSNYAFWEWLESKPSVTSGDIDLAIEILSRDKFYITSFIDSVIGQSEDEQEKLLADDDYLEKKYSEFVEGLNEAFFGKDMSFYIDEKTYLSYFPEDTKELIYLSEEMQDKVKNVIREAVETYPPGFVPQYLKKLYIIGDEIEKDDVDDITAIVIDETIFITNGKKQDESLYLLVFHHIFNHLLQNKYNKLLDSYYEEWISINPEGFEYYNYEPYYSDEDMPDMYKDGFISTLSMMNYMEDFAETASHAFSKNPVFYNSIMDYSRIRQKFELMADFYSKINPEITLEYFEKISGQELGYSK